MRVSIHAPREGCDFRANLRVSIYDIVSIHAPREGCDVFGLNKPNTQLKFQFTHPGRGATEREGSVRRDTSVSIHAPREGCDVWAFETP